MKAPITIAVIALHLAIVATILVPGCKSSTENAEPNPEVTKSNTDVNNENVEIQPVKEDDSVAILDSQSQEGSEDLRENPMRPMTLEDEMLGGKEEKAKGEKIEPKKTPKTVAMNEDLQPSSTYIVKKGDTLSGIAAKHGVNLSILMEANGMNRKSVIKVGQKISIPAKSASAKSKSVFEEPKSAPLYKETSSAEVVTYVVEKGDNLSKIASKYRTSVAAIMELNGMSKTSINVGKKLKIPTNTKSVAQTAAVAKQDSKKYEGKLTHTVKSGDTLGGIAIKYGVPLKTLMEQNGIQDARKIRIGKVLIIKDKAANSEKTFEDKKPQATAPVEVKTETSVSAPAIPASSNAPQVTPVEEQTEAPAEIPSDAVNTPAPQAELPSL